jgi:hypothetical protein
MIFEIVEQNDSFLPNPSGGGWQTQPKEKRLVD